MNVKNPSDWLNLKAGSTLALSDEQSLMDSKKRGFGLNPISFTVTRVTKVQEAKGLVTYIFVDIEDGVQPLRLMVKIVDENVDFRLYYKSEDFVSASRQTATSRGDYWLFQQPPDENNFTLLDLKYTIDIKQTIDNKEIVYSQKPSGELSGIALENPARTGLKNLLATITEYKTKQETENPELMLFEIGDKLNKDGGEITLYFGSPIHENEIQVLALK